MKYTERTPHIAAAIRQLTRSQSRTDFGDAITVALTYLHDLERECDALRTLLAPTHPCEPPDRDPREPTGDPARLKWTCECGRKWIYLRRIVRRQVVGEWRLTSDPLEDMRGVPLTDSLRATLEQPDQPVLPEVMGELAARHPENSHLPLESFGTHKWYIRTDQGLKPMVPGAFSSLAVYPIDMPPGCYVLEDGTQFKVLEGRGTSYPTQSDWHRSRVSHPTVTTLNYMTQSMARPHPGQFVYGDDVPAPMDAALHEQLQEDAARDVAHDDEWRSDELPRPMREDNTTGD